jgi:hypothetical protein
MPTPGLPGRTRDIGDRPWRALVYMHGQTAKKNKAHSGLTIGWPGRHHKYSGEGKARRKRMVNGEEREGAEREQERSQRERERVCVC